ncbi:hypothetical protein ACFP2T_39965 [Plantactinospora solaniradicis]|uniref:PE domain-containing protein n=1 Tax=Plantactinospora solaniradicis TaxID=1723736 RepID=A0ABW1KNC1_9ACTN
MSEVTVITRAVYNEAKKWKQLSDKVEPILSAVRDLDLSASAFYIGDANTFVHSEAYNGFQNFCEQALAGAAKEFDQLGAALDTVAEAYDRADRVVSLDLNKIYAA